MTLKQISTLHYILGRLEGMAENMVNQNQKTYLLDTCELLDELMREEKTE